MTDPLYVQAHNKTLGPVELMDRETLAWIKQTSAQLGYPVQYIYLNRAELSTLKQACPKASWFYSPQHITTIHGIAHCVRVMIYSAMLCKLLGISKFMPYVLASAVHDVRRLNDNEDSQHGNRAGDWFRDNLELRNEWKISDQDVLLIETMVKWHQIEYDLIEPSVLNNDKKSIDIIKAADALDRFRMPKEKWWPQPDKIALLDAHALIGFCRALTLLSEEYILDGIASVDAVFKAYDDLILQKGAIRL